MDFEPYFKAHNLVNAHPKNIKLGQMTNLDMIFYVMVSDYRLINIWNSPQFPVEFRNGLYKSKICELGLANLQVFIYTQLNAPYNLICA